MKKQLRSGNAVPDNQKTKTNKHTHPDLVNNLTALPKHT
jgi:hypothetical protein